MIDESDDIYSIIQILFYMLLGKTTDQISFDTIIEKSFNEYVEGLADCHPEAYHLLRIYRLIEPRNKALLNMSNIQGCMEDLLRTEAIFADKKTHFLSELINPETFHNLRSLLVLIGKITCEAKKSKDDGKRSLVDSRDILVNGSLDSSDYTVTAASIKAIPGLDGTAHDEKDNVRKIGSLLREVIDNSKEPICDGINCVGRRKLAKLLDDECCLSYDEFNNAIEELKNYSNPDLTYFDTNAEEPIISQSFDLISGDWDNVIKGGHFHTNNYAAFINQLIEQIQGDENGIICVLRYDDNVDEMLERIPATIPYDKGYGVTSIVSDNLEIENEDNLYIVVWGIWGIEEKKEEIYNFLKGEKGKLNNNKSKKKVNLYFIDDKLSNVRNEFIYNNGIIEENELNDTFSILKCIEKQNLYGISYDGIKYVIGNIGKDESVIDELIRKQYVMLICGQVYISSRVSSELKAKCEKKETEDQSLEMLEKIFHYTVSKTVYKYNDELSMFGILKTFGYMIKIDEIEIEALIDNVRNKIIYNSVTEVIIKNVYNMRIGKCEIELYEATAISSLKKEKEDVRSEEAKLSAKYISILMTEAEGCERELNEILIESERKLKTSNVSYYLEKRYMLDTDKFVTRVVDICKRKIDDKINVEKFENEKTMFCLDVMCKLIFNNYDCLDLFPTDMHGGVSAIANQLWTNKYRYKHIQQTCKYLFEIINYILNHINNRNLKKQLHRMYVFVILSQFEIEKNGLIKDSNRNKGIYKILVEHIQNTIICDIPVIEVLKLLYYTWENVYSDKLLQLVLKKSSNKFLLAKRMLSTVSANYYYKTFFSSSPCWKVILYNAIIDKTNYMKYVEQCIKDNATDKIYQSLSVTEMKDIQIFRDVLLYTEKNRNDVLYNEIKILISSPIENIRKVIGKKRMNEIVDAAIYIFTADFFYKISDYKRSLKYYNKINTFQGYAFDITIGQSVSYINKYKYNICNTQIYINFMKNMCNKIIQMEELVNLIGPDRFNMDNLDRENFVSQGKALVDEVHELVLQRGYGYIDRTIISFMTMYKLMRYLCELDDRVTYEKYYNLLSNKIKYCRKNYRDCIVYDNGKFIHLTDQQMVDCMIDIEKYRTNKKANDYTKLVSLERIADKIGSDRFDMDNLDREDFVEAGKALVEEINSLALQEGYSDKDSTIISFMTMYELMRYLYELDDRATYEKYYGLLSDKIKYHKKISSDCIVYNRGKFVLLTYSQMTGYMIDIEKYHKMFDKD